MRIFPATLVLLSALGMASAQAATPRHGSDAPAAAATPAAPAPATSITTLQTITVTGVVPGPGLWEVRHGDRVLWILGVVPTLPSGIQWRSGEVERIVAASQAVIEPPDVKVKLDTNWLGKLFLLPSVYSVQRNPDGKHLQDVLPPALFARWDRARRKYFGDDRGIDRYRPLVAAAKMLKKALRANGLRSSGEVVDTVKGLADKYQVKLEKPLAVLEIREPRQAVKVLEAQAPQGVTCLGLVLDAVEHELPDFRARANAWATGDIDTLRKIPPSAYRSRCKSAITGAGFANALGISDLPARIEGHWLAAVDAALASNSQTLAILPMHELLAPDGYLAALRSRGYTIVAPDTGAPDEPNDAATGDPAPAGSVPAPPRSPPR